jgi:hypothetical protein
VLFTIYQLKMPVLQAKVKSVLSGDTLILTNPKGAERTLSLAYVSAPRLKRGVEEVGLVLLDLNLLLTSISPLPSSQENV